MQQPSLQSDIECEQCMQALPPAWEASMRELGAFTYAGKIRSPRELLRAIFLYCGPDQSVREVAGTLTLQTRWITEQAVWKRLQRCTPCLEALVKQMLPLKTLPPLPPSLRFLACDGTTVQRPGAPSPAYRLPLVMNFVSLRFHEVPLSDHKQGETLKHSHLQAGAVAVVDQGYGSYTGMLDAVYDQGADVIVRWNHQRLLYHRHDTTRAIDVCQALKQQPPGTLFSLPVRLNYAALRKNKDKRELFGSLHVYRMTAKEAHEARKKVRRTHRKKQRTLSDKTLFLRQFVLVLTAVSSGRLSGEAV